MKNSSLVLVMVLFFVFSSAFSFTNASEPVYDILHNTSPTFIQLGENVRIYAQVSFVQSGVGVQDVNFTWYVNGTEVCSESATSSTLIYTPQAIGVYLVNATVNGYSNGQVVTVTVLSQTTNNFKNITAEIQPLSPTFNESHTGEIPLNLTIGYASQTPTNSTLIPYQEIVCQYNVDNGSWNNATLVSASTQKVWYDPTFRGYWNQIDCNYSGLLEELSNGRHSMNITLTPSLQYSCFVLSNGTTPFVRIGNGCYNALANSTVDFYVYGNYDSQASIPNQEKLPLSTTLVIITASATVVAVTLSLLLYRRHRKQATVK
jgi:hypothetical protein